MGNNYNLDEDSSGIIDIPNQTGSPERRLLLGILERAILDYVGNDDKEAASAVEWLFDDDNSDENHTAEFTFNWVCNQLDLDKKKVLIKIKSMPKRGINRVAPWYFDKSNNNFEFKKAA